MIELIKKDWRLNRVVVVGNLVIVGLSYLLIAISMIAQVQVSGRFEGRALFAWREGLVAAGIWGIMLTILLGSVYGGIAFALERRERWGDFLNMLPVQRRSIVVSKLVVASSCMAMMIAVNSLLLGAAMVLWSIDHRHGSFFQGDAPEAIALLTGTAIMLFGVAWMLSSFMESPALSACIAIAATFATCTSSSILTKARRFGRCCGGAARSR
jgi:ABC-type transport system involved in multi-copper enzyme maturation permease subunit